MSVGTAYGAFGSVASVDTAAEDAVLQGKVSRAYSEVRVQVSPPPIIEAAPPGQGVGWGGWLHIGKRIWRIRTKN